MGRMELRPDGMEGWGARKIVTEAKRLVREHHRLFVPFYLAFSLSESLLSYLPLVLLKFQKIHHVPTYIKVPKYIEVPMYIEVLTLVISYILIPALSALGLGGVAYIVEHIYSGDDTDDTTVTRKVFKQLPHALWRSFVTALWSCLVLVLVTIAHFLFALLFCTITGSNDQYSLVLAMSPWIISVIFLGFIFAFNRLIALLEPGRYGKEALFRSAKMVRVGGVGTILAVYFSLSWLFAIFGYYPSTIANTMESGWILYAVLVVSAVCISFLNLFFYVVVVVMYYVYTSRFAADVSGLPKFAASEEHPYTPLADEAPPVGQT